MTKPKAKAPAAAKSAVKSAQPKTPASKAPAKPPSALPAKLPAKLPTKSAAKMPSKPIAEPAAKSALNASSKASSKSVAQRIAKPVSLPGGKPAPSAEPKPAPQNPTKTAAKPVSAPVLKSTAPPAPAPIATPAVKAAVKPAAKPASRSSSRGIPPVAPASPPSNRFTDRFAPARHVRPPDPIEVQKSSYKADPRLVNAWKTKPGRELSVPELMAMPDTEYMNDKQVDFFRTLLRHQRDELLSNAGETTEHLREDTTIVPDPADRATIEEEHALELRTRDRERKLLKKISQSLIQLDSNEYGFCDETGEPIGLARLLARPTATLSLEAQQRRELKQKMFGD